MKNPSRLTSLLLCLLVACLLLPTLASCANTTETPTDTKAPTAGTNAEGETEEIDPFAGINYGGDRPFNILTSTNVACTGMGNSNYLIEGETTTTGNLVNDAVLERNVMVSEMLGIELIFTQIDEPYNTIQDKIRILSTSGMHEYDLIINDLYPFANLSLEGTFRNILDEECKFDFTKDYWYADYMEDLRLVNGYQYLLAGDYFIDLIRSAHCLLMNKDIYYNYYKTDADEVYDWVLNYEWTYDKMNQVITDQWADKNNSGEKDKGDQFGFLGCEFWGNSIPFTVSGNPQFITRDEYDGTPTISLLETQRANDLANAMAKIFHNESSSITNTLETELLEAFVDDQALIVCYQRLGSLENSTLRGMEGDIAILPYPMLYASDKQYVTSTHDTSELGAIMTTNPDLEFTSIVTEVLCRETSKRLMPKYYKEALQVQYVDDSTAASMIDIIHDNFRNSFILAYNNALGSSILESFTASMRDEREFSVVFKTKQRSVNSTLKKSIESFKKKNQIDD